MSYERILLLMQVIHMAAQCGPPISQLPFVAAAQAELSAATAPPVHEKTSDPVHNKAEAHHG